MVRNADGTFSVTVDPNPENINLPPASVLNPMIGNAANERYMAMLSKAYLETLPEEYVAPPPVSKEAELSPVVLIVAAAALFTLGHALGGRR